MGSPEEGMDAVQNEMPEDDGMSNEIPDEEESQEGLENGDDTTDDEDGNDKKKEIQSKTGELSQLLNDYGEDDEELKKYVKGMIDSALDKIGEDGEDDSEEKEDNEDEINDIDDSENLNGPNITAESVKFKKGQLKKINENFSKIKLKKKEKKNLKKNPFNSPNFK